MIPRRQFQMADRESVSAVYTLEPYFTRLYVQTAITQKNHQIFSRSINCKMLSSQNWSAFSLDRTSVNKNAQNPRRRNTLRLYPTCLHPPFLDGNLSPYYYVIENQKGSLNYRNRNYTDEEFIH